MDVVKTSGLSAFGDSFTVGYNATNNNGYAQQLAAYIEGPYANYGVGSSTSTVSAKNGLANLQLNRTIPATWMAGLNDIRGTGLASLSKLENNLRAFLCAAFLKTAIPASLMTKSGSWTDFTASQGGKALALGGRGQYTNDINAYLETTFEGDNVVIGAFMTSGTAPYTYQDLEILIDGQSVGLFNCLGETNENISHGAKVINGLGSGTHTIRIKPVTATNYSVIDYVGTLSNQSPVLVSEIPYLLNWSQYNSVATKAICDEANILINNVVNEFSGYNVDIVKVNDFYDALGAGQCSSDGIHPTSLGHSKILNAFKAKISLIQYLTIPQGTTQIIVNDGTEHIFTPPLTIQAKG